MLCHEKEVGLEEIVTSWQLRPNSKHVEKQNNMSSASGVSSEESWVENLREHLSHLPQGRLQVLL